jgi:hypothetical protein
MRALILILSGLAVAFAVSIVLHVGERPGFVNRFGPLFPVGSLLADAQAGERAAYREASSGRRVQYTVVQAPRLPPIAVPYKTIRRELRDAGGQPFPGAARDAVYSHRLTDHGWFPLMAPEAPEAFDRVWVVAAIRRETISWNRQERPCWRVDCIDPALPEGSDTVVAWIDVSVPVFGLLKYKRAGETWEYEGAIAR